MIFVIVTILLAIIFYLYDFEFAESLDKFTMYCVFGVSGAVAAIPVTFVLMLIALFFSECLGLERVPFWVFFPETSE